MIHRAHSNISKRMICDADSNASACAFLLYSANQFISTELFYKSNAFPSSLYSRSNAQKQNKRKPLVAVALTHFIACVVYGVGS